MTSCLPGDKDEIRQFREAISKRFIVGQFTDSGTLGVQFVCIITQHDNWDINYQWKKYIGDNKSIKSVQGTAKAA